MAKTGSHFFAAVLSCRAMPKPPRSLFRPRSAYGIAGRAVVPARLVAGLVLALGLAACDSDDGDAVKVVVIGDSFAASVGAPPANVPLPAQTFSGGPHLPGAAQLVRAATAQGLVGLDEEGRVIPALADRWIVTADGRHYIFRLADGTWPDNSRITGESARSALRQALDAQANTPLGLDLAGVEDVRAMAGRVVEIRLSSPMPDLLQLLAQPELGLLHRGRGAGPMALTRRGNLALLTAIPPEKRGLAPVDGWGDSARPLQLRASGGAEAIGALAAGQADVVLGGTFIDLPRTHHIGLGKSGARPDPVAGLFGLMVTRTEGLLATPQMRETIAMAIDRDALAWQLGAARWKASTRIISPGMEGDAGLVGERWQDMDIDSRRILAQRRIEVWSAGSPQPPTIRISLPEGPGADILLARLTSDLGAIGVTLRRAGKGENAELALIDMVARYPHVTWFLNALSCRAAGQTKSKPACSPAADALAARARRAPDEHSADLLWAQAETLLTQTNGFIPLGPPIRWSLVNRETSGFSLNRLGVHPLLPLAMRPKS